MGLIKIIVLVILLNLLLFGGYYLYENYLSSEVNQFVSQANNMNGKNLVNVSSNVSQFYSNMRFNHNDLSYYINPNCEIEKRERMKQAFAIVNIKTEDLIKFYPTTEANADILVGCSADSYEKEENIFVAGEGGPTKIINSSYSVIMKGKVLLYNDSRSICDKPILELHELLHVFGYDHIKDNTKIMFPYLDCKQELNQELIDNMIELYTPRPFAEIYFENVNANKKRYLGLWYLNFNVSINNQGIIDSEDTILKVSSDNKVIESFELNTLIFGGGKNFYVNNLQIDSETSDIEFSLETKTYDQNLENNVVKLNVL